MRFPRAVVAVMMAAIGLGVACQRPGGDDIMKDYEVLPSATTPIAQAPAPVPSASVSVAAPAPPASSSARAVSSASASTAAATDKPPAKEYACGDKGKPDCPMQRWMKSVAAGAAVSGDAARIGRAFNGMGRAPPGMGAWSGIAAAGAAKAAAGDFDGAKAQCKVCHGKYQSSYHARLRDIPWPLDRGVTCSWRGRALPHPRPRPP